MSVIIRARYEGGVLRPLSEVKGLREGEVVVIRILRKDIAEEAFSSIKVGREKVERALREAEDEFSLY